MNFFVDQNLSDAEVLYCEDFFKSHEKLYRKLDKEIEWEVFPIRIFGKVINQPRETSYIGDKPYKYSGFDRLPKEWTKTLKNVRNILQKILEQIQPNHPKLNSVLCNKYKTGDNYIGKHSDDEKDMNSNSYIVSVSLGATRDFIFEHKRKKEKIVIPLESGSVVLMGKNCQKNYLHSIPKSKKVNEPRINLTFRSVLDREEKGDSNILCNMCRKKFIPKDFPEDAGDEPFEDEELEKRYGQALDLSSGLGGNSDDWMYRNEMWLKEQERLWKIMCRKCWLKMPVKVKNNL